MDARHQILLGSSFLCAIAVACSSTDHSGSSAVAGSGGSAGSATAAAGMGTGASSGQAQGGNSSAGASSSAGAATTGGSAGTMSETMAGAGGADDVAGSPGNATAGSAGSSGGSSAASGAGGTSAGGGGASTAGGGGTGGAGGSAPLLKNGSFEDGGLAPWQAIVTPTDPKVTPSQLGKSVYTQWANAQGVSADGKYEVSYWNGMYAFTGDLSQTVTGLAPGNYRLTLYIAFGPGINQAYLYAINCGAQDVHVDLPLATDFSTFTPISIPNIKVSEPSCTVGIYADMNVGNWLNADDFVLEPVAG